MKKYNYNKYIDFRIKYNNSIKYRINFFFFKRKRKDIHLSFDEIISIGEYLYFYHIYESYSTYALITDNYDDNYYRRFYITHKKDKIIEISYSVKYQIIVIKVLIPTLLLYNNTVDVYDIELPYVLDKYGFQDINLLIHNNIVLKSIVDFIHTIFVKMLESKLK